MAEIHTRTQWRDGCSSWQPRTTGRANAYNSYTRETAVRNTSARMRMRSVLVFRILRQRDGQRENLQCWSEVDLDSIFIGFHLFPNAGLIFDFQSIHQLIRKTWSAIFLHKLWVHFKPNLATLDCPLWPFKLFDFITDICAACDNGDEWVTCVRWQLVTMA